MIHFADGARVCVDGLADGGTRCPTAVRTGPSAAWRLVPYLLALFASTSVGLIWYAKANNPDSTPYVITTVVSLVGLIVAMCLFFQRPRG